MVYLELTETGHALGEEILSNDKLYENVKESGWDVERARDSLRKSNIDRDLTELSPQEVFDLFYKQVTGVEQRPIASNETVEDLAFRAAKQTISSTDHEKPRLVIVPNFTDLRVDEFQKIPNTGLVIAHELENNRVPAFSMNSKHDKIITNVAAAFCEKGYDKIMEIRKCRKRLIAHLKTEHEDIIDSVIGERLEDAVEVAKGLMDRKNIKPSELELVIFSSLTEDDIGSAVSKRLGLNGTGLSINTACAGFAYGCAIAEAFIDTYGGIIVSAAEKMSSVTDSRDHKTLALFGDGAGAALFKRTENKDKAVDFFLASDYSESDINLGAGEDDKVQLIGGKRILRRATESMEYAAYMLLLQQNVGREKIKDYRGYSLKKLEEITGIMNTLAQQLRGVKMMISHDANKRITDRLARKFYKTFKELNLPEDFFYSRIKTDGNCSGASSVKNVDFARREGILKPGEIVHMPLVAGGYSLGSVKMVMPNKRVMSTAA